MLPVGAVVESSASSKRSCIFSMVVTESSPGMLKFEEGVFPKTPASTPTPISSASQKARNGQAVR